MPCQNSYVNYGIHGICRIDDICSMKFDSSRGLRDYYILKPLNQESAKIFVPADNHKLTERMRPVLSPEEIDEIILSTKDQNMRWISDRKQRASQFQSILMKRDERELLLLVSCLYLQSKESAKGISNTDTQILKKAEHIIEQEFSFSLKISKQNIGCYIREKLGLADDTGE